MASDDAAVEELVLRIDCAEGREAQNSILAELHEGGAELAGRLAEALPSLHGDEAALACWALSVIGPEARDALPVLEEVAGRRSLLVLKSAEAGAAERAIVCIRADEPQFVLEALQSQRTNTRLGAAGAIASERVEFSDEQALSAAETLAGMLSGRSWSESAGVVAALCALGPHAEQAVPRLTELATAEDPPDDPAGIRRLVFVQGLGALGQAGLTVGPVLAGLLTDPQEHVRQVATRMIRKTGPQGAEAISPLLRALAFESPAVGMVGPGFDDWPEAQQRSALEGLEDARLRHQAEVRAVAAWTLGELGVVQERVLPALTQATRSTEARVRYHAVTALGRIGEPDEDVCDALCRLLDDDGAGHVRRAAARALGLIGRETDQTLASLADALDDVPTRKSSAWALKQLEEAALPATPALMDAMDRNECRRAVVVAALVAIGPETLHDLRQGLSRDGRWQRIGCAEAVAAFGAEAESAEPALRELLFDRRTDVRDAAEQALEAIREASKEASEGEDDE